MLAQERCLSSLFDVLQIMPTRNVLVLGATGFVGRALRPLLQTAGFRPRCASRRPEYARAREPGIDWVFADVDRPESLARALAGCEAAVYLVHGMGDGPGYVEREAAAARAFCEAADRARLRRIVYLGGVDPAGLPSTHLWSRLETGRILREGPVEVVEIRAAMVAGPGSLSWQMVRDLAARLPAVLVPSWLEHGSWPVYVDDVCAALVHALDMPLPRGARWFDAPGPERIKHGALIRRVAEHMHRAPPVLPIRGLSPQLSSHLVAWITRADVHVARELVHGLASELDPSGVLVWSEMPGFRRTSLDETIERCLAAEASGVRKPQDLWQLVERPFGARWRRQRRFSRDGEGFFSPSP